MSAADDAYAAAIAEIARVKAAGEEVLRLNEEPYRALTVIPPQIADIPSLRNVYLDGTAVSDLTPFASMKAMQYLSLGQTGVTDLTPLAGLTGLWGLSIDQTKITDFTPLAFLTGLQTLSLNQAGLTDLTPFTALTRLQELRLEHTGITDLTPLAALTGLRVLSLQSTGVSDLTPLSGLTGLQRLYVSMTGITDLTPLAGLTELQWLVLTQTGVTDLTPLAGLSVLQTLSVHKTQVADLTPLAACKGLQQIWLGETRVSELTPLAGMTELISLVLTGSQVCDLRPIRGVVSLRHEFSPALDFANTPATAKDAELARLAEIENDETRTRETLAYLNTLPPWPQPLPWQIPDAPLPDTPLDAPETDTVPRVVWTDDNRIDVQPAPPDAASLRDPIRARLYDRLPGLLDRLVPHGNRYPEINGPLHALRDLVAVPFDQADILLIHLEIAALTDLRASQSDRPQEERLDADCDMALLGVLRAAPGITIGHPDVDMLEQRTQDYARQRLPETVAEGERWISQGLINDPIATDRTQEYAIRSANALPGGRSAEIRRGFVRNVVIVMGIVADAATGMLADDVVLAAAQFLFTYKDAIIATSAAWGETGYAWASYILMRAKQILDDANTK